MTTTTTMMTTTTTTNQQITKTTHSQFPSILKLCLKRHKNVCRFLNLWSALNLCDSLVVSILVWNWCCLEMFLGLKCLQCLTSQCLWKHFFYSCQEYLNQSAKEFSQCSTHLVFLEEETSPFLSVLCSPAHRGNTISQNEVTLLFARCKSAATNPMADSINYK